MPNRPVTNVLIRLNKTKDAHYVYTLKGRKTVQKQANSSELL